jgi:subtilisin family serine protease
MARALMVAATVALLGAVGGPAAAQPGGTVVVGYQSAAALRAALRHFPAREVRTVPALRTAEVRVSGDVAAFSRALRSSAGIRFVHRPASRASAAEPALVRGSGFAYEWQYGATQADAVPHSVLVAASRLTIAVIDTGADLTAPDLAAKGATGYDIESGSPNVSDSNGHGTFVSALAAGSTENGDGIAGFGGDVRLLAVQAGDASGEFTDVDEAAAIVYAVDHGARIVHLSLGGRMTSRIEREAISYAAARGVLVVAAAGNEMEGGKKPEYPAALLQPPGSHGRGGVGLAVAASTHDGLRAAFSNAGSYVSLAAPGDQVFGALSSLSSRNEYPRVPLPGSLAGVYGFASGTSFAAPEVAGVAALVWAANPLLSASQVADILKQTATGGGWTPQLGYGVIDASAAVAAATGRPTVVLTGTREPLGVQLHWRARGPAAAFRVAASVDGGAREVVAGPTTGTATSLILAGDHDYAFTVEALDSSGKVTGASEPYRLSLR